MTRATKPAPQVEPAATRWTRRHLLGLEDVSADEIRLVLDTARSFKEVSTRAIKKVPALRGKTVVNLFFEAEHAHAHLLRDGRQAPDRRRAQRRPPPARA